MAIGTHTVGLHLGSPQIKMPEIILYVAFYVYYITHHSQLSQQCSIYFMSI